MVPGQYAAQRSVASQMLFRAHRGQRTCSLHTTLNIQDIVGWWTQQRWSFTTGGCCIRAVACCALGGCVYARVGGRGVYHLTGCVCSVLKHAVAEALCLALPSLHASCKG